MFKELIKKTAAVIFWILIWWLLAVIVAKPLLLPDPVCTAVRLFELAITTEFWLIVLMSLARITVGIVASILIGVVLGILCAKSEIANHLISPVMSLVKATPVASFIMLALLWLSRDVLPIFISVLIVVPVVVSNIQTGVLSVDKKYLEVAYVFRFSLKRKLKRIYVPMVYPYFISACKSSLGLAWKAGIAAEVLAVPVLSIGKMIYDSKLYLETVDLFAWTVVVVLLSAVIEFILCSVFKKFGKAFERQVQKDA